MIGLLVSRELTISLRRGSIHLLAMVQAFLALALVGAADQLGQQVIPFNPPGLGSTTASAQTGLAGVVASFLDAALFLGETTWLLLFALVAVPAIAGPAIARERERGTLGVLLGTGATPLAIVGAKSLAVLVQVGLVLLTALPALGLVIVFGSPSARLILGSVGLVVAWSVAIAAVGMLCSALARSSGSGIVATFAAALGLAGAAQMAPALAARLDLGLPGLAYQLNPLAALLSLHADLGQRLADQVPNGAWLKAAAASQTPFDLPWLPFAAVCLIAALVLVLLASLAVSRAPGRV